MKMILAELHFRSLLIYFVDQQLTTKVKGSGDPDSRRAVMAAWQLRTEI